MRVHFGRQKQPSGRSFGRRQRRRQEAAREQRHGCRPVLSPDEKGQLRAKLPRLVQPKHLKPSGGESAARTLPPRFLTSLKLRYRANGWWGFGHSLRRLGWARVRAVFGDGWARAWPHRRTVVGSAEFVRSPRALPRRRGPLGAPPSPLDFRLDMPKERSTLCQGVISMRLEP